MDSYTTDKDFRDFSETLDQFDEYLELRNDRVWILSLAHKTGFDNMVEITGNRVQLKHNPEDLVFDH